MRIVIKFYEGLTINFEGMITITDERDYITLHGGSVHVVVNGLLICTSSLLIIKKNWLICADEVYLDTRIEEVEDGSKS